jgi:hypothetical protein
LSKLKHQKIKSGLRKKGFKESENDHTFLTLYYNGVKTEIWTKVSLGGGKEIGEPLIHRMAAQLKLNKKQFIELIDCIMSPEDYFALLEKTGIALI